MSQAHTYNPIAVPNLRLVRTTDPLKESAPRATDSLKESVPNSNTPPQPHPAPQAASPKPQAVPYERLLTLYLDSNLSLADIAFTLGLSIADTLLLTTEKDFKTLLSFYADAHEQRAAFLARCNVEKATRTLVHLTESKEKPETARKAAGAIVRLQQSAAPQKITPELQLKAAAALINCRPQPRDDPPMKNRRATFNSPQRAAERRKPVARGASPG